MKKYNKLVDLALKKGWKPSWGTQPKLGKFATEEDLLLKMTAMQKWLRNEQGINVEVIFYNFGVDKTKEYSVVLKLKGYVFSFMERYKTYEDALFDGLTKAFKEMKDYWINVGTY